LGGGLIDPLESTGRGLTIKHGSTPPPPPPYHRDINHSSSTYHLRISASRRAVSRRHRGAMLRLRVPCRLSDDNNLQTLDLADVLLAYYRAVS